MYKNDPYFDRNHPNFIPVAKPSIDQSDIDAVVLAMQKNEIALGESIIEFEKEFAQSHNLLYGASANSGASSLILALAALPLKENDYILIPNFSMIAIVNACITRKLIPFFCDSDDENIIGNTSLREIKRTINETGIQPKCIIIQHSYGVVVQDIENIAKYCKENNIYLIEDAAESIYSSINSKSVGSFGDLTIFSMYGNKIITGGECGVVLSNNKDYIDRIYSIRAHAFSRGCHFSHTEWAFGLRLPNISAALVLSQHKRKDEFLKRRYDIRKLYESRLSENFNLHIPIRPQGSVDWIMPIVMNMQNDRDNLRQYLATNYIESRTYFIPLSEQQFLKKYILLNQEFKQSLGLSKVGFYVPLYPSLSNEQVHKICDIIDQFFKE